MDATAATERAIHAAAMGDGDWDTVVREIGREMGAYNALLFGLGPPGQAAVIGSLRMPLELAASYFSEAAEVDVIYQALQRRHGGLRSGLSWSDEVLPRRELLHSRLYGEYLGPNGLDHIGGMLISGGQDGLPMTVLTMYRPAHAGPLFDAPPARLRALQPQLNMGLVLGGCLRRLAATPMEAPDAPACVGLCRDGRVRQANAAAEALLAACMPPLCQRGRLRPPQPGLAQALDDALQRCAASVPGATTAVWLRLAGPPGQGLVMQLLPAAQPTLRGVVAWGRLRPEARAPGGLQPALRALYELTAAEAAVVEALARGHTPEGWAQVRGVSAGTVRTQLRAVFAKTGARGQPDLMRLAFSLGG